MAALPAGHWGPQVRGASRAVPGPGAAGSGRKSAAAGRRLAGAYGRRLAEVTVEGGAAAATVDHNKNCELATCLIWCPGCLICVGLKSRQGLCGSGVTVPALAAW